MGSYIRDTDALADLYRALDGAELVIHDATEDALYAWNGSHTVNVFAADGTNIDVFEFGYGDTDPAELGKRAGQLIRDRIERIEAAQ